MQMAGFVKGVFVQRRYAAQARRAKIRCAATNTGLPASIQIGQVAVPDQAKFLAGPAAEM